MVFKIILWIATIVGPIHSSGWKSDAEVDEMADAIIKGLNDKMAEQKHHNYGGAYNAEYNGGSDVGCSFTCENTSSPVLSKFTRVGPAHLANPVDDRAVLDMVIKLDKFQIKYRHCVTETEIESPIIFQLSATPEYISFSVRIFFTKKNKDDCTTFVMLRIQPIKNVQLSELPANLEKCGTEVVRPFNFAIEYTFDNFESNDLLQPLATASKKPKICKMAS